LHSFRGDLRGGLATVNVALTLAVEAEVDPSLVSMLYFPEEHQLAVLLPLWAPLVLPLLGGLIKEIKRYRDKGRAKKEKSQ